MWRLLTELWRRLAMRSLLTKVTNLSQVEHSDVEAINRIMEKAGYEIFTNKSY